MEASKDMLKLAAQFNFFAPDAIPAMYFEDDYFRTNFENKQNNDYFRKKNIPEFLLNSEFFEVGEFCEIREQFKNFTNEHELYFVESYHILVWCKGATNLMLLQKDLRGEKYTLFPIYNVGNKITYKLSSSQYREYTKRVIEPNKIGAFTDKKVLNWVNYCNEYYNALKQCESDILSKKNENQAKINNTIEALPNCKVSIYKNYTTLETDMFRIEFQLLDNGEYLDTKITYKGGLKGIIDLQR